MHTDLLEVLSCPSCSRPFPEQRETGPILILRRGPDDDPDAIADGALMCAACGAWFPVDDGLLDLRPLALQDAGRRVRIGTALGLVTASADGPADAHKTAQAAFFTRELEGYERDVVGSRFYQALDANTVHRWGTLVPSGTRVLDIGAGTGRASRRLAARGCRVVALDLTEPLLRRAQAQARADGLSRQADFVLGDAEQLPFRDGTFGAALAHGVLHHLDRPEAVIAHVGRALQPGGRWFSLDPNRTPLRGVFDAAMRLVPLWEEEASSSPLQDERRLTAWCDAAGIDSYARYTCYILPHALSRVPVRLSRWLLDGTDALFARAPGISRWAGVIVVSGVRRGAPPVHPEPRRRGRQGAVAAMLVALLALATTVWKVDASVAARSASYYMGGLETMLGYANAPARTGVVMLYPNGQPLEQGTLDDIGYLLGAQLLSAAGVQVTGAVLAQAHLLLFIAGAVALAAGVATAFSSVAAGLIAGGAALTAGNSLRHLLYAQVTNQSITPVFPPFVLSALALVAIATATPRGRQWLAAGCAGVLTGLIDLARHAHGLAVLGTLITWMPLTPVRRKALVALAVAVLLGVLTATIGLPTILKAHRDVVLRRPAGLVERLERPPSHHIYYTLLTAIGRYPNALGLTYADSSVDAYIATATAGDPQPMDVHRAIEVSRRLFVDYVVAHPGEWVRSLMRGAAELPPFIAYVTFTADRRWELGWPGIAPGVHVDDRDRARYGENLLMNVRWAYVRASAPQWLMFGAAWVAIAAAVGIAVRRRRWPADGFVVGGALYLAWVALPRALVPVQGLDLVMTFWLVTGLATAALLAWRPAGETD